MTRPRMVLPPPETSNPIAPPPALAPFSSMIGALANPGCVVPSIVTGSVIVGSAVAGWMVCGPSGSMLKVILSAPATLLALRIASRSVQVPSQVPSPGSALEFTTKPAAGTQFENSEVLFAGSVAVAVTNAPGGTETANCGDTTTKPCGAALVTPPTAPMKVWPSPLPEGSQAGLW